MSQSNRQPTVKAVRDHRKKGWYWLDNDIVLKYGAQLEPLGIAVYNVLAQMADDNSQSCWPSYSTIARLIGVSRKTAIKGVQRCADLGLITLIPRPESAEGDATSNIYYLLPLPEQGRVKNTPPDENSTPPCENASLPGGVNSTPKQESGLNENREKGNSLTLKQQIAAKFALENMIQPAQRAYLEQQSAMTGESIESLVWRFNDYEAVKAYRSMK